jgi:heme exporter protein A
MVTVTEPARPLVELADVDVRLGGTPVLRRLRLQIDPGEVVGLIDANGSGKTTLLRVLATLLPPTAGRGTVLGAELGRAGRRTVRPAIALLGHVPALYPKRTLWESLEMVARLTGAPLHSVADALESVGLAGVWDRRAEGCSQGMLRRTDFARALITAPRLLLLDEAHAGLDAAASSLIELAVAGVRQRRGGAVVVAHDPVRLRPLADRTLELAAGRLWSHEEQSR